VRSSGELNVTAMTTLCGRRPQPPNDARAWIWLCGDDDDKRSGGLFPRHGDDENVAHELPHLDTLHRLDNDNSKVQTWIWLSHFFIFRN
jgi:hypothetical protein